MNGILKHRHSHKDYSHAKTFGAAVAPMPAEYLLVSTILNQGTSFECTAYASCAIKESRDGIRYDPDWFYQQEGVVNGQFSNVGYSIRTAMQTGVDKGFKPLGGPETDGYAHAEDDYYFVRGDFDSIKTAMWQAAAEKRCVSIGTMWYDEWTRAQGGLVPTQYGKKAGLHDFKCAGWTTINGAEYLVCQNSYGTVLGKGGLWYFPREVVNREFFEGAYIYRTGIDPEKIRKMGLLKSLCEQVIVLYKRLIRTLNL